MFPTMAVTTAKTYAAVLDDETNRSRSLPRKEINIIRSFKLTTVSLDEGNSFKHVHQIIGTHR